MLRSLLVLSLLCLTGCTTIVVNYPEYPGYFEMGKDSRAYKNLAGEADSWGILERLYVNEGAIDRRDYDDFVFIRRLDFAYSRRIRIVEWEATIPDWVLGINKDYRYLDLNGNPQVQNWLVHPEQVPTGTIENLEGRFLIERAKTKDQNIFWKTLFISAEKKESHPVHAYLATHGYTLVKGHIYRLTYVQKVKDEDTFAKVDQNFQMFMDRFHGVN